MQKVAFLASFLAVFLTADNQLFDGVITRYSWDVASEAAHDAQLKIATWVRRH